MRIDRLKKDADKVINLEEIRHARGERTSLISTDIESMEEDLEIPEDIELTWMPSDQDMQPTDYEEHYDEAIDTHATDDLDEVRQDQVHDLGEMTPDDVIDEPTTEILPDKFTPDEETEAG